MPKQIRQLPGNTSQRTMPDTNPAVFAAADILRHNSETPPRLLELARQAGLSHPRLNKAFHQCFGTTAFGYLRALRLEEARRLLVEEKGQCHRCGLQRGLPEPAFV